MKAEHLSQIQAAVAAVKERKNNPQIYFVCMRRLSGIHDANSVHV